MKASEIIAEIKGLSPEGYAEVSAFMMSVEREDPALRTALQRKQTSTTGQVVSRPYEPSLRPGLAHLTLVQRQTAFPP